MGPAFLYRGWGHWHDGHLKRPLPASKASWNWVPGAAPGLGLGTLPFSSLHTQHTACSSLKVVAMKPTWYSGTGSRRTPMCPGHLNQEHRHVLHSTRRSEGPMPGSLGPLSLGRFLAYTMCSVKMEPLLRSISSAVNSPRRNRVILGYTALLPAVTLVSLLTAEDAGAHLNMKWWVSVYFLFPPPRPGKKTLHANDPPDPLPVMCAGHFLRLL